MAIDQEMIAQKTTINPKNLNLFMNFSSSYTNRFRRLGGKKAQHIVARISQALKPILVCANSTLCCKSEHF